MYNYLRQEEPEWVCGPLRRHPSHLPGDGAAGAAKGWDAKKGGLKLECDNYPAFAQCRESIAPNPDKHCFAAPEAEARRAQNGICDVVFGHDTIDAGTAASGPLSRRWANQQYPVSFTDTYPSIPAGGSLARTDTLPLKPGVNKLTLALDQLNQVKETNENDNIYQVTITVNGTCGLSPRAIQPRLNLPRK